MSDLISREDVIRELKECPHCYNNWIEIKSIIESLPSAEPKTEMVLCALADRTCPFRGKEFAWCLTCPHISEEDRSLVKKAVSEPKTGAWIASFDGNEYYWYCNRCKTKWYEEDLYMGGNEFPKFCPECGSEMHD